MSEMIDIRVFYKKLGRAKYISHLDITRLFQRSLSRTNLPIWYTQGFNPHMYLTFALPLPIYYESECEVMDLRLTENVDLDTVTEKLNSALPSDIQIIKTDYPKNKPQTIETALSEITLLCDENIIDELNSELQAFICSPQIIVTKKTKKGDKQLDIKPDIDVIRQDKKENSVVLFIKTSAGITKNINPTLLVEAFLKDKPKYENVIVSTVRKRILMANGENFK